MWGYSTEQIVAACEVFASIGIFISLVLIFLQLRRDLFLKKIDIYQSLEFEANTLFRFEAQNSDILHFYQSIVKDESFKLSPENDIVASSFLYQTLNLLEIAADHRRQGLVTATLFGSWVAWFYDVHNWWYFREMWPEIRCHYKPELKAIFDIPVRNYAQDMPEQERKPSFYKHVAAVVKCNCVKTWMEE